MLYIVNEMTFSGYNTYTLDLLYIIAILLGILVIISKNPIVSVLFLIGLFLCISCYLILTGLNFIGLSYLLVYIGAVSILFLFILMLINVRISELSTDNLNSIPLAMLLGSFFNYFVNNLLPYMVISNNLLYYFSIKKKISQCNICIMRWVFSRNFSYNKYRKYFIWKLFYLINNYIHYIIISYGWMYCNYFKRKKLNNFMFKVYSNGP